MYQFLRNAQQEEMRRITWENNQAVIRQLRERERHKAAMKIVDKYVEKFLTSYYAITPIDQVLENQITSRFRDITNERNDWSSLIFDFVGRNQREQLIASMPEFIPETVHRTCTAVYYRTQESKHKELHKIMDDIWFRQCTWRVH